jgi:hypothetical protein
MNGVEARTFRMLIETMGHGRSETRRGGDPGCGISEAGVRGGEPQGTHGQHGNSPRLAPVACCANGSTALVGRHVATLAGWDGREHDPYRESPSVLPQKPVGSPADAGGSVPERRGPGPLSQEGELRRLGRADRIPSSLTATRSVRIASRRPHEPTPSGASPPRPMGWPRSSRWSVSTCPAS